MRHAAVTAQVALPTDDSNLSWRFNANVTDMDPDAKAVLVGGSNDNRVIVKKLQNPNRLHSRLTRVFLYFSQFWTSDFL